MNAGATTAGLGLFAAATWGGSDFVGGLGARRAPAMLVVGCGHLFSFLCLFAWCKGFGLALPAGHDLLFAALGGFEGSLALAVFYRALAMGAMGLTAALTGLLTALIPVLFSFAREGMPPGVTIAGLAAGLVAIWLITHTPADGGPRTPPRALLLGAVAGCGFGAQLVLFKLAAGGGLLWTMTSARAAGTAAMVLAIAVAPPKAPWKGFWITGLAAGTLDTLGNLFYLRAAQLGRLDVAALVASMYPAGTILLAAVVLRERPTRRQLVGMGLALGAVLLLSA
ncbi:MAG: DMT family transporter [Terracidiphilus sp.]|nr:DMT family transporter [Terracidiphilus sp.]